MNKNEILNGLSIDVEDYFQVSAFESKIQFSQWSHLESRVFGNTVRILEILEHRGVKATFFILGWIGEKFPKVVNEIHEFGHEVACHSYNHQLVYNMTPDAFREDIRRTKGVLEDLTGCPVVGFRAPSYSIVQKSLWSLDILIEEGFLYDSSIFPIYHDRYGLPGFPRHPYRIRKNGKSILEFPPSTVRIGGFNFPISGGGFFRVLPYSFFRWGIKKVNQIEKESVVVYLHPWEVDRNQPRINGGILFNPRHYINLGRSEKVLKNLIKDFSFVPIRTLYENLIKKEVKEKIIN